MMIKTFITSILIKEGKAYVEEKKNPNTQNTRKKIFYIVTDPMLNFKTLDNPGDPKNLTFLLS